MKTQELMFDVRELGDKQTQLVQLDILHPDGLKARAFILAKVTRQGIRFTLATKKDGPAETEVHATAKVKRMPFG